MKAPFDAPILPYSQLQPAAFADDVPGACLDFVVDSGNVMPDDPEADHEDAADYQLQEDDGGETFERRAGEISVEGLDA